jgi:5'-methylthioadenosine phosphorylase
MYQRLGGDVIGMTNLPEAVFARECGLCYSALAYVSNLGAGLAERPITRSDNYAASVRGVAKTKAIIRAACNAIGTDPKCLCAEGAKDFVDTEPE